MQLLPSFFFLSCTNCPYCRPCKLGLSSKLHCGSKICCKWISSPTLKNEWRNIPLSIWLWQSIRKHLEQKALSKLCHSNLRTLFATHLQTWSPFSQSNRVVLFQLFLLGLFFTRIFWIIHDQTKLKYLHSCFKFHF